ncbi:ABC transporter ATP-binding protein [Micromonospora sp. NPDC048063]|uniref:ABC transporter ATP-binding protein n=1 Tax=Micromonospora sp. NPDC048063 TaxID=3364256 RepID=UPI00372241C7
MLDSQSQTRMSGVPVASPVVVVEGVSCAYGEFVAVDDVTLSVQAGQIHALLGTNGAGKTTLLESIQGFRSPTRGALRVFGRDPWRHRTVVAGRTGTMLQESGLVDEMTVGGQLALWQGLSIREDSIDRVLDVVGLDHRRKTPVSVLSGGERRRLDFAMAIWGGPEFVVLDEPTTGLDPQSRRTMWTIIQELNAQGSTVLLTTHYLDEAQHLAEHVTILDRGRVALEGPMGEVLAAIPAQISFTVSAAAGALAELGGLITGGMHTTAVDEADSRGGPGDGVAVTIRTPQLQIDVGVVTDWSRAHNLVLGQLRCAPASLEEVFFDMPTVKAGTATTGKVAR